MRVRPHLKRVAEVGLVEIQDKIWFIPDVKAHVAEFNAAIGGRNSKRPGTMHIDRDNLYNVAAHIKGTNKTQV